MPPGRLCQNPWNPSVSHKTTQAGEGAVRVAVEQGMNTPSHIAVSVIATGFRTAIRHAEEAGGHEAIRSQILAAELPEDVRGSLLSALAASERNYAAA